ncbi:MAG: FkbM family methyltransferase [Infirmifilum sp.]
MSEFKEALLNYEHIYVFRDYEKFAEFLPGRSEKIVDLGGYVGLYSIRSLGGSTSARSYIVEANPLLCSYIYWNLRLNKLENRAKVLCSAVDATSGVGVLYVGESMVNSSLMREYVEDFSAVKREIRIPKFTLGEILEKTGFPRVDLLKMDVEGVEEKVLLGSREVLEAFDVEKLLVELHEGYYSFARIREALGDMYKMVLHVDESTPYQGFLYALSRR